MKTAFKVGFLVICVGLVSCARTQSEGIHYNQARESESPFPFDPIKQLALLNSSDPLADARSSFRRGDHRLVGLGGMVIGIPCLENHADLRDTVSKKFLSGTGEGVDYEYTRMATKYARKYNMEMLRLLTENH